VNAGIHVDGPASVRYDPYRSIDNGVGLLPEERRKAVLVVLFVPSVERDGHTSIDQSLWVQRALELFGAVFGGATAYPRARGVWRDDAHGGALVFDEPVVVHCYTTPEDVSDEIKLGELGSFCRRMGHETHQGEVGLIIDNEYLAIRDFSERRRS
jgi:hypothetical protein